MAILKTKK